MKSIKPKEDRFIRAHRLVDLSSFQVKGGERTFNLTPLGLHLIRDLDFHIGYPEFYNGVFRCHCVPKKDL